MDNPDPSPLLLTVFSTPKAFQGATAIQQHNAIQSWSLLGPEIEVLLIGDDAGTAEAALRHGVRHIQTVDRTPHGTPLISSIFCAASEVSTAKLLCYVNADIILMSDFRRAVHGLRLDSFLMCGQRRDLDLTDPVAFDDPNWEGEIRYLAHKIGKLHATSGMDYFVFPRGQFKQLPTFVVGRAMWDNWLVFHTRTRKVPIVDSTEIVMAIHQNHHYQHVKGGIEAVWTGPEAQHNRTLASDMLYPFTIDDATWRLTDKGLSRKLTVSRLFRLAQGAIAVWLRDHPSLRQLVRWAARAAPSQSATVGA
jgi:hypothetical protein